MPFCRIRLGGFGWLSVFAYSLCALLPGRLYGMGRPQGDGRANRSPSYGFSPIAECPDDRCVNKRPHSEGTEPPPHEEEEAKTNKTPRTQGLCSFGRPHGRKTPVHSGSTSTGHESAAAVSNRRSRRPV